MNVRRSSHEISFARDEKTHISKDRRPRKCSKSLACHNEIAFLFRFSTERNEKSFCGCDKRMKVSDLKSDTKGK